MASHLVEPGRAGQHLLGRDQPDDIVAVLRPTGLELEEHECQRRGNPAGERGMRLRRLHCELRRVAASNDEVVHHLAREANHARQCVFDVADPNLWRRHAGPEACIEHCTIHCEEVHVRAVPCPAVRGEGRRTDQAKRNPPAVEPGHDLAVNHGRSRGRGRGADRAGGRAA
jgi:hypothetical protein